MTPLECMESFVLLFLVVSGEFWHDFSNIFNAEKLGGGVLQFLENWKILDFGVVRNKDIKWITSYSYRWLFLVVSGEFWHDFSNVLNVEKLGGGVLKFLENWKILDFGVVRNKDIKWIKL